MSAASAITSNHRFAAPKPGASSKEKSTKSYSSAAIQKVVSTLQLATSSTRMMILLVLSESDHYAGEIREALKNPSQPSVSHQLSLLRHGRLVEARREGRKILYHLSPLGDMIVQAFAHLDG